MSKEVLAVDIDEVCFPLVEHFLVTHNALYETDLVFDDFTSYHFDGLLGITVDETVKRVYEFLRSDHSAIEPLEGIQDALERLSKNYDLEIVTARHPQFEEQTRNWLQEKLPDYFRGMELVGYAPIMERPLTKSEVCKKLGATAMIDDSINHLEDCMDQGIESVLFGNYPWNQAENLPFGITRCRNWQEVAEYFNV